MEVLVGVWWEEERTAVRQKEMCCLEAVKSDVRHFQAETLKAEQSLR